MPLKAFIGRLFLICIVAKSILSYKKFGILPARIIKWVILVKVCCKHFVILLLFFLVCKAAGLNFIFRLSIYVVAFLLQNFVPQSVQILAILKPNLVWIQLQYFCKALSHLSFVWMVYIVINFVQLLIKKYIVFFAFKANGGNRFYQICMDKLK